MTEFVQSEQIYLRISGFSSEWADLVQSERFKPRVGGLAQSDGVCTERADLSQNERI